MDALRHVNNSRYFTYCEMANFEWFGQMAPGQDMATAPVFPVLAHMECDYLASAVYPARLKVFVRAVHAGRTSIGLEYLVRDADKDVNYAFAHATLVFVDKAARRPHGIPEDVRRNMRLVDGV